MSQWEADIQRCKEAEDKLQDMFKQQQKIFQQQRVVQVMKNSCSLGNLICEIQSAKKEKKLHLLV